MVEQLARRKDEAEVSGRARICPRDVATVGETPNEVVVEIEQVKWC